MNKLRQIAETASAGKEPKNCKTFSYDFLSNAIQKYMHRVVSV